MNDQWYCGAEGQQYGPYSWDQLRAMAGEGRIVPETHVRREIDQQWLLAAQIPGLLGRKKPAAKKPIAAASAAAAPTANKSSAPSTPAFAATKKLKAARPLKATAIAPPVQPAPSSGNIPVGQAVAPVAAIDGPAPPVSVPVGFAIVTTAPPKAGESADDEPLVEKKSGSPLVLIGVLGGAAVAIAVVGIALVAWSWSQPASPEADELAEAIAAAALGESVVEANPGGAEGKRSISPTLKSGKSAGKSADPAGDKSLAAAQRVISSQGKWSSLLRLKAFKINAVSLEVTSVWLATDLAGTRVEPHLPPGQTAAPVAPAGEPAANPPAVAAAPVESADAQPSAKYVFVEVRVTNGAPVARRYNSWNAASSTAAILANDASQVLAPVPPSATAGIKRLANVQVPPGQAVMDVLVFEAPPGPFESLKLALAKASLADGAKGHWAIEVPLEALFRNRPSLARNQAAGGGPVAANQAPLADGGDDLRKSIAESSPQPVEPQKPAAAATPPPKTNKPPSVAELNKQFEEFDKPPPKDAPKDAPKEEPKAASP